MGDDNTATGYQALFSNITGIENTATGVGALRHNTVNGSTAHGYHALFSNTTGFANTATGHLALAGNTTANDNTAMGWNALSNSNGEGNTAVGQSALGANEDGNGNTAIGSKALRSNTTGNENTAVGERALFVSGFPFTGVGTGKAAVGNSALLNCLDGDFNVAIGWFAGFELTGGENNVFIGAGAGNDVTTAENVICIGSLVAGENVSNSCYIDSIFAQASGDGVPVFVNSADKLGTTTSSKRFKQDMRALGDTSRALFSLKPVAFHYKNEIDLAGRSQFGLVAEEVEKVNPDLVVRDKEGKPYSVRSDQVNAMLLNEFLKEHRKNERQEATIAHLQKQIEALTAGLQKVSAQVEMNRAAPQVVNNP